jgi:L-ascorbate metabolism protein UlaG (beta-lactamase superfamily)
MALAVKINYMNDLKLKTPAQVIYLGGPTVIFEIGGLRIMTDPTLDPPGDFAAGPDYIIKKLSGPAISDIGRIDLVLLSHDQHDDNLDKAGRDLLNVVPRVFSTTAAAQRLGGNVKGMNPWETKTMITPAGDEITITATPARHGPHNVEQLAGEVIGFMITINGDIHSDIYLTGDTVFYEGVNEVARKFKPKYVFVFAGAARPRTPFSLTMDSNDVVDTAAAFPDSVIIPVHYEGWSHYSEGIDLLIGSFGALGIADRLKILSPGVATLLY